ncbi:MAG: SDR family NAD(P)-dependent oxidoreductase [Propioniciclava sp.]
MSVALVTGATSGIGAAFVRQFAARGDDLVLVARDAARLTALADELADQYGVATETIAADLGDPADLARVADRIGDAQAPIDICVNNAGFGMVERLLGPAHDEHERAWAVMGEAVVVLSRAAGQAMRTRGTGQIINVSSLAAWLVQGDYSAIKSYVKVYTESLAVELQGTGVTVTALCPGWVHTDFHHRASISTRKLPGWVWVDAEPCVRGALADADRGKVISLPDWRWKVAGFGLQHLPRSVVQAISRRLVRSRGHEA